MDRTRLLANVPLLQGLSPAAAAVLVTRAAIRRFPAGKVLWTAGSEARGLYIVLEGSVRVVRAAKGRQYVLHTEGVGGTLGEVPVFSGGRYPATAIAAQPTTCLVLDRDLLTQVFRLDPEFAFRLLARLAERVRILVGRLDRNMGHSVVARVAAYILARHERAGGGILTLGSRQVDVAEELGTVREVLVRSIRELREAGMLESAGRGRYRVTDLAELRRTAGLSG